MPAQVKADGRARPPHSGGREIALPQALHPAVTVSPGADRSPVGCCRPGAPCAGLRDAGLISALVGPGAALRGVLEGHGNSCKGWDRAGGTRSASPPCPAAPSTIGGCSVPSQGCVYPGVAMPWLRPRCESRSGSRRQAHLDPALQPDLDGAFVPDFPGQLPLF